MKQRYTWRGIVLSGIVFCVLLTIFSIPFYQYLDWGYQYQDIKTKSNIIQNDSDSSYDALFLGDSQGWATYAPIQLYGEYGFTSYNACTSGQFPYDGFIILKNFYKTKKTNLVVLDANMIYTSADISKVILMNLFPVFHYHNVNIKNCNQTYSGDLKGFNRSYVTVAYNGPSDYMLTGTQSSVIEADGITYLKKIYEITKENNSQLLLVSTVNPLNWNQKRHDCIQKWCDEHDVKYLDYNETTLNQQIDFDYSNDFRDGGDHLNLNGSKKICTSLGAYMKTNYDLGDHRKDEKYQAWNQLYADASEYH